MRRAAAFLAVILAGGLPAATEIRSTASLASPLENQGVDARSLGMGSALMGLAPEASAQLWNPAGLSRLKVAEASLHHHSWVADIFQETLTAALPTEGLGTFGLTANYAGFGTFEKRDASGQLTGNFDARRFGGGLAWAREWMGTLSLGAGLRMYRQDMGDGGLSGYSGDLGVLFRPLKQLALGLSYANLGATDSGAALASGARLALAWDQRLSSSAGLLLAAGTLLEPGGVSKINIGLEGGIEGRYFARGGYLAKLADNQLNGLQGLSLGLGAALDRLRVDYAWQPYGELGTSHRVSLSYAFESAAPDPGAAKPRPATKAKPKAPARKKALPRKS